MIRSRRIVETGQEYSFLFYGYDWLGFAHIVIALAFIGPYRDPVKNERVIQFGMIACILVIPFALLLGALRHIPFWWRIVDCCFGIVGIIPLAIVWVKIQQLKNGKHVQGIDITKNAEKNTSSANQLANG